jgi:excisionase family DNA binding protein
VTPTTPPSPMEVLAALDVLRRWMLAGGSAEQAAADAWVDSAEAEVPQRTIRRAVAAGELTGSRVGKRLLVRRSELDRWIGEHRAQPRVTEAPSATVIALGGRRK